MVRTEHKTISGLRFVVLVLALTLLLFACIGAVVALLSETSTSETPKPVPQVRQIDRESFRQESRNNGS